MIEGVADGGGISFGDNEHAGSMGAPAMTGKLPPETRTSAPRPDTKALGHRGAPRPRPTYHNVL